MRESNIKRVKNYSKRKQFGFNLVSSQFRPRTRAHARKRWFGNGCTCTFLEARTAAKEIMHGAFAEWSQANTPNNLRVWSWYCRHFNRQAIIDKAYQYAAFERNGEIRDAISAFQHWLQKTYKGIPLCI